MSNATEIEKTNLEAHAELCAERYENLESKLSTLDGRMNNIESGLDELKTLVTEMKDNRNNQLIAWGVGVIAVLISAVSFLVYNLITNKPA
jgi:peptidoglycan hydrolase CwlO-like protein